MMSREEIDNELENNERAARQGFAQKRVVWFGHGRNIGQWKDDWFFYLQNEHTLLSMWRCHALHPFDRFDRAMYFFCIACLSLFLSAYLNAAHPVDKVGYGTYFGWMILCSMGLVAYEFLLKFIAVSPCMQPGGSCHDVLCSCCRECCIDLGKQGLYVCAAGSAGFMIGGIVIAVTSNIHKGRFFLTFVLMRCLSYLGELGPHAFKFYNAREKQRQYWHDGVAGGAYPLGPGVPDPEYLFESRLEGFAFQWQNNLRLTRSGSGDRSSPNSPGNGRAGNSAENPLFGSRMFSSGSRNSSNSSLNEIRSPVSIQRERERERRDKQLELLRRARERVSTRDRQPTSSPTKTSSDRQVRTSLKAGLSDDALDTLGNRLDTLGSRV